MEEIDLGKGTFLEKWPNWLRWVLFLPATIIAPFLFLAIQYFFSNWFLDLGENAFYFNLLRGIVYGGGSIIAGSMVAPRKQRVVALFILTIISMISGVAFLAQFYDFVLNELLEDIITVVAAVWATHYIFKETA